MKKPKKSAPRPGRPVRGSRTGRPVMALIDLLGRRWTLRVLWELRDGPLVFRALQEACGGLSPSVLSQRLSELREVRLVETRDPEGYALTPLGAELVSELLPVSRWAERWSRALATRGNKP
ncbi:MAG TPA: helix-turn-helix domain-containing protein [Polyangiaceae bacterium]|nr:helix-turn-helix domain-containing protein [Polyangiaceae bacterium]